VTLAPGTRLGVYEVVAPLGAGGMGEVWRARDARLGRDVAVKVLPSEVASSADALGRFEREARAVAALSHPNILAIFDVGRSDGVAYAVLELLEGETLRERLAAGPLAPRKAIELAAPIARALAAAHERGIVHRDLKPENLFVTKDGVVKVLDFGLARVAAREAAVTSAPTVPETAPGTVMGTVGYMSPEQVRGHAADHRSDVFSLGCVLYEMVTGRRAFQGESAVETMSAILKEEPPDPSAPLPPALREIVRHCMEKRPEDRFQSARDLAFALESLSLSTTTAATAARGAPSRSRWLPWIAAALALVLVGLLARALLRTPAPAARQVRFSIPPPKGGTHAGMLALSPDGSLLAFVATGEDGNDRIWLRPVSALDAHPAPGTEGAAFPFFSPDGRHIGFFAAQSLKTLDVASSAVRTLCRARNARGGTWGSSGLILFAPSDGAEIDAVAAAGGEPRKVLAFETSREETSVRWPNFLPDGRRFVYLSFLRVKPILRVASVDGPQRTDLVPADSGGFVAGGSLVYASGDRLLAQRFDEKRVRVEGPARPLDEGIYWDLFASGAFGFSLSASGDLAYLAGGIGKSRLSWYDRGGKRLESVGPVAPIFEPVLSPDGTRAAFSMADPDNPPSNIWVLDLARGGLARVSEQPGSCTPLFSADGKRIAYSTFPTGRAYARDASGATPSKTLMDPGLFSILEDWTADGRLYFTTLELARYQMQGFVLPAPGAKPEPLLTGPGNLQHARPSPDGRWLAYVSDESGRDEVMLRSFPDGRERFAISAGGGSQPCWRADGKELFYVTPDRKVMSVEVVEEPGKPSVLFQTRVLPEIEARNHFTAARDGRRFLVNERPEEDASRPVVVVLTALAEPAR
jgi:Tol biopolymer transport system component